MHALRNSLIVLFRPWILRGLWIGWGLLLGAQTAQGLSLNPQEIAWVQAHRQQVLTVGFDPYSGVDSFSLRGKKLGLLPALLRDMKQELGLQLVPAEVKSWDEAYTRFLQGKIDVLYGANVTPERERIMQFTREAQRYPYTVFARRDASVQTLGDLDGRRVGFLANDFVIEQLPKEFPNIRFKEISFEDQSAGLQALTRGEIDSFVTAGGGIEHEFVHDYPSLSIVAELRSITSDMTFAVLKERSILAQIINRYLEQSQAQIDGLAKQAKRDYNRKVLRLNDAELDWLEQKGSAAVGVAEDYLPFDYAQGGRYLGIAGATLQRIGDIVGIRFKVESGSFAQLYERAKKGELDVLNLAKTEARLPFFFFPHAISTERDIIIGLKRSEPVQDVYGLEGKSVAVIEGFWHEEYLLKNLKQARIIKTGSIQESLKRVREGKADYLIENPTVAEFYINGLGYTDLVKRGNTSKDSFIYFGVSRQQPELAAIMDKVIPLIQFEEMKYLGMQTVPALDNEANKQLSQIIAALGVALTLVLGLTVFFVRKLVLQKAKTQFLREREHLLYTDSLTGFQNRNAYNLMLQEAPASSAAPLAVVVADMNKLKQVNDSLGHAAGDALIQLFADCARQQWPQAPSYRIGGDEFVFLVAERDAQQIEGDLEALRQRCQNSPRELAPGHFLQASAALGYAIRQAGETAPMSASMMLADASMYRVKAGMKKRASDFARP